MSRIGWNSICVSCIDGKEDPFSDRRKEFTRPEKLEISAAVTISVDNFLGQEHDEQV